MRLAYEERLTDVERQRLIRLVLNALAAGHDKDLSTALGKLTGVDTVVCVRRAYPSTKELLGGTHA